MSSRSRWNGASRYTVKWNEVGVVEIYDHRYGGTIMGIIQFQHSVDGQTWKNLKTICHVKNATRPPSRNNIYQRGGKTHISL